MFDSAGFPAATIEFDKDANPIGDDTQILALAQRPEITDLIIMSHGWNNDIAAAGELYANLSRMLFAVKSQNLIPGLADRGIALAAVLWPSKKFADKELIPGGAAAAGPDVTPKDISRTVDELGALFPPFDAANAKKLIPQLEYNADARANFAATVLALLDRNSFDPEDATKPLTHTEPGVVMERLSIPIAIPAGAAQQGGAASVGGFAGAGGVGGAARLGGTLGGWLGAAQNLLNLVTYYAMKGRAGDIGERGLAPLIERIHQQRPDLRIHLVGHSFGGRLVTAAASALPGGSLASLTLLQAAFSHYGLSDAWSPGQPGHFRAVLANRVVAGPILITHTANDRAVGIAYALASRVADQPAAGLGDANDVYGGIGRNGAQKTPEATNGKLLSLKETYQWNPAPQNVHNLLADAFIANHSDITSLQVAYAILSAVAAT